MCLLRVRFAGMACLAVFFFYFLCEGGPVGYVVVGVCLFWRFCFLLFVCVESDKMIMIGRRSEETAVMVLQEV